MMKSYNILLAFSCAMFSLQAVNIKKRARTDSAEQQKTSMEFLWNSQAFEALKLKSSETFEKLKHALEQGANPNACDFFGTCLLSKAVMGRQQNEAELLLQYGAVVNFVDKNSQQNTPLHWAALQPDLSLMRLLTQHDTNPNPAIFTIRNADNRTPADIGQACFEANLNNPVTSSVGRVPTLHVALLTEADMMKGFVRACTEGRTDIIDKCLANSGMQFLKNIKNKTTGDTPLHYAVLHGQLEVVRQLCDAGARLNANKEGKTALDCANATERKDIADHIKLYQFQSGQNQRLPQN
jgi:ankyrin repeat protein